MNNTNTVSTNENGESKNLPDYQVAAQELAAFYATLDITAEISGAHAAISKNEGMSSKGWAHVALTITFTRPGGDNGPGTPRRASVSFSTPHKMGVGLARWNAILAKTHVSSPDYPRIKAMAGNGSLSVESQRDMAGKYLSAFVKRVSPAEVLANLCRDGLDASGQSFESWASEYGYDTDSWHAEKVYLNCQKAGDNARKILSHSPGAMEKLADLAGRL